MSGPHICLHQLATRHPLAHRGLGAAYQRPLTPSSSTANTCVMRDTASNSIASRAPYISSRTPPLPPRPTRTQLPIPGGGCLNTHSTTPPGGGEAASIHTQLPPQPPPRHRTPLCALAHLCEGASRTTPLCTIKLPLYAPSKLPLYAPFKYPSIRP